MPETDSVSVKTLQLDLRNYRTVPQANERTALHTMVSINPDRFWGLTSSLLTMGFLPTENIIILKEADGSLTVKEGNRRIAALKLILGHISRQGLSIPRDVQEKIQNLDEAWRDANQSVPCAIYQQSEESTVDNIVTLTHGKGEQAARDRWTSVATARHNREKAGGNEFGLDLLEEYLHTGRNITAEQRERWSGDYPLTVLNEAVGAIARRLNLNSRRGLVDQYKAGNYSKELDEILRGIGLETIGFKEVRTEGANVDDFPLKFGFPPPPVPVTPPKPPGTPPPQTPVPLPPGPTPPPQPRPKPGRGKIKSVSVNDPRAVHRKLKQFAPRGKGREKLTTLLEEARLLKLERHPHSFCFLLRSMFELSAKAFITDHPAAALKVTKGDGSDRNLIDILREIAEHLTDKFDKKNPLTKPLHGAMTELGNTHGFLSMTSMNQLIHNPKFVVTHKEICPVFARVFPLLEEMNR